MGSGRRRCRILVGGGEEVGTGQAQHLPSESCRLFAWGREGLSLSPGLGGPQDP